MKIKRFWRRISLELYSISVIPALITAAVCFILGILVAVSSKGYGVFIPRSAFPVFFVGLFWEIFYALIGFALGCFLFSGDKCMNLRREQTVLLFLCSLVLAYAWTAVVWKAGNFLLGILLCFLLVACLLTLFFSLRKRHFLSGVAVLCGCFWIFYVIYYTFSLMFFHL